MKPAIRTQVDEEQDFYSLAAGIHFTGPESRDVARQEFKEEADVNQILARYGVNAPQRQAVFGETDFTLDLQQAFGAIDAAKSAHHKLPPNLKEKYPTWQSVLNAIESGQLRIDLRSEETVSKSDTPEAVNPPA